MVSNVCINWRTKEILLIFDPKKNLWYGGCPGGKMKEEESVEKAGPRELFQETNQEGKLTKFRVKIPKDGPDGPYIHNFVFTKIIHSGNELKNHEDEKAIPRWVPLEALLLGKAKMFPSHVRGLVLVIEKMAEGEEKRDKIDKNKIPILSETMPGVAELLDELKKIFDENGHYVRKFVPQRLIRAGYRPFDN